jgi:hypothetical protein
VILTQKRLATTALKGKTFLAKYSFLETTANFKEQAIQGVGLMVIREVIGRTPFLRNNKEAI